MNLEPDVSSPATLSTMIAEPNEDEPPSISAAVVPSAVGPHSSSENPVHANITPANGTNPQGPVSPIPAHTASIPPAAGDVPIKAVEPCPASPTASARRVLSLPEWSPRLTTEPPVRDPREKHGSAGIDASRNAGIRPATIRIGRGSPVVRAFRRAFFPEVADREWNDWKWQARHRFRTLAQLERVLRLSEGERTALGQGGTMLPVGITPYYLALLDRDRPDQPLRKTVIPRADEFVRTPGEADDPLGEDGHSTVPGLVHRYPDRVLFLALDFCTTYCRYCTRSRVVGHGEITPDTTRWEAALDYIRRRSQIRDVLISGGEPLSMADEKLDWLLSRLRAIPHVEFLRIGTKIPAVLPQRVTPALARILRRYHPLWMSVHYLHPDECTSESSEACGRLADAGIPLGSQTVLLAGVNDTVDTMKHLVHRLLKMRVRPYYLYQCDPISGSSHFRTPVEKGLEIIAGLRGHTTGYACPTYVIDAPGGGGKIPLLPDYVAGRDGDDLLLRNFEGRVFRYPDPVGPTRETAVAV